MSIFSTGLSGLNAAQNALATTSNNISNVFTPGYNREVTILGQTSTGGGGVQVNDIQRQFNDYVAAQLNAATSKSSALETYANQVGQIDSLLADREAGLAPLMQNFFSSLEDLASAPSDPAARQGVLGSADSLSAQFRSFDGYLQDMQQGINGQIADEVTQINNTTEQLAGLNREIALARARSGEAPNGLLNQRDQLVNELSERMDVRLNIQDGKTYNVSLPNGQPLVAGTQQFKLEAMDSPVDPQRTVLGYRDSAGSLVALDEDTVTGGTLGGLMDFRAETLDKTQNQIGQMAVSLAVAFNQQHANGVDLDGEPGGAFFDIGQPRAFSAKGNDGSAEVVGAAFDTANIDQLKTSDYRIRVTSAPPSGPADFDVTRLDGGGKLDISELSFEDPNGNGTDATLSFGGVTLTFDDTASMAQNDRFDVQPVRRAAGNLESAIADLDKIAAGSLVHGDTDAIKDYQAEPGQALASGNAPWSLSVTDTGGGSFEIVATDDAGNAATGAPFTGMEPGDEITVDGITLTLGELEDGQTLTLDANATGSGDNRNALALQDLQDESIVGDSASLSGAYGAMVSDVGNRTNIVQVNLDAQQGLTDQLKAVQQSESGVNLDEEAANLIRYQQFYQANAKVIDTGKTVIDTILGLRN
ncbi:flagellar hook-associated protein FlgK [Halomonas saccharevitans]|uniref:Flagellar hook-associated protein 1 n=1 Tax=Halomonas saccharevitans TaxID=416872 RepID=A0A1I6Z002_9GAMM|nr:flagellar hook-associated protein FlgK [Halomonas saccharevitans]SFT55982.1 flagellar hook-associated protein 1 FlgK [Halomonas saccharevitans]